MTSEASQAWYDSHPQKKKSEIVFGSYCYQLYTLTSLNARCTSAFHMETTNVMILVLYRISDLRYVACLLCGWSANLSVMSTTTGIY